MQIQKLASYDQRMQEYSRECRAFWLKEFSVIAAIGAVVVFGTTYGLSRMDILSEQDWPLTALLMWALLLILPVKIGYPEKPNPEDVLADQALRRIAGMDDSVEE